MFLFPLGLSPFRVRSICLTTLLHCEHDLFMNTEQCSCLQSSPLLSFLSAPFISGMAFIVSCLGLYGFLFPGKELSSGRNRGLFPLVTSLAWGQINQFVCCCCCQTFSSCCYSSFSCLWSTSVSCLLYTSPSPRDDNRSRMPSSA